MTMKMTYLIACACVIAACCGTSKAIVISQDPETISPYRSSRATVFDNLLRRRCPLCDSSVYGYCSDKLFHDSCCCHNSNNPYDKLPVECQHADCSFLHANSCYEHKLITACCCTNYLLYKK